MKRLTWIALCCASLAGCSRHDGTQSLTPPFDDRAVLGSISAVWTPTSDERGFAGGDRLDKPQAGIRYRVDARNRSGEKVFIRLADFQLVDLQGLPLGADETTVECILPDGELSGVLGGEVWIPKASVNEVKGFRVATFAVPLDDKGRRKFRDWQLQGRPDAAATVDAEIARLAAAPACQTR